MTKQRPPLTPFSALSTIAGLVGWPRVADVVSRSERTVRNWSEPDTSATVTYQHMLQLDSEFAAAGGGYRPFAASFCAASDVEAARLGADAAELALCAAEAARESGQGLAATFEALRAGASDNAFAVAEHEVAEACEAESRLLQKLRSLRNTLRAGGR